MNGKIDIHIKKIDFFFTFYVGQRPCYQSLTSYCVSYGTKRLLNSLQNIEWLASVAKLNANF